MYKKIITLLWVVSFTCSGNATVFASLDLTTIPLGDGKTSASAKVGYVYSCQTSFNADQGGAGGTTSWIHGSTWSLPEKLSVMGKVVWPNASYSSTISNNTRTIVSNSLPVDSYTGTFPIASTDPAYKADRNPNNISAQSVALSLPASPTTASAPTCLGMGMIGVALNGVAIFNALDAGGRDAVAHELQDTCGGHPQQEGEYHYHGLSTCIPHASENNALIGYALDGFGIYSNKDASGKSLSNSDLDECHGTTSTVIWDGKSVSMYHYVFTNEYPYTLGCFKGTPIISQSNAKGGGNMNGKGMPQMSTMLTFTGITTTISAPTITSSLSVGSSGSHVEILQAYLEEKGYLTIPKGQTKGYFGNLTKKALMKYQEAHGISTTGTFGPLTRTQFNKERLGATNTQSNSSGNGSDLKPTGGMMTRTPPQAAFDACSGKATNASCSFTGMQSETVTGSCITPPGQSETNLVCAPKNMGAR